MSTDIAVPYPTGGLIRANTAPGWMRDLLAVSSFDHDMWEDSFKGDQLRAIYPAAKTNGTSAAVTFTEHNAGGFLELVSGTDNAGYAGQGVGLNWTGDRGVLFEAIIVLPAAITTMKFEVGLSDADDDAGAVNQKATATTATATDFAVFCFDTSDDANIAFITAKAGVVVENQDLIAAVASGVYRVAIRVDGDNVKAWLNDNLIVIGAGGGAGIEGGNKLTPWAFVQARAGAASRTVQIRKWRVSQPAY